MWKIIVVLVLTALAILTARLIADVPLFETRTSTLSLDTPGATPPLMYAGIRG